ncbi:brevican core protein-like [Limulus polyphemus]|uniref:Brevican core protein-like n=1 Tax=Limulus polyphemus TaxID=6850 RepID=A0ABM1S7Z4_LIMPO|nr:brevican core protein-like [Limulus polyphemus]
MKEPTTGRTGTFFTVVSLIHCCHMCVKDDLCIGIGYSASFRKCQLLSTISESGFIDNVYYDVWVNKLSCTENPCKNGATCLDDSSGLYKCICLFGFTGYNCETPPVGYQFHSTSYFKYYSIGKTEPDAEASCNAEGARLAKIPDLATHQFLKSLILEDTWIGVLFNNGQWQYEPTGFNNWAPLEPTGNGLCTYMWSLHNFQWDDCPCTTTFHYLCEIKIQ